MRFTRTVLKTFLTLASLNSNLGAWGSTLRETMPLAAAEVEWNTTTQSFRGRVVYEYRDEHSLELQLYLNRYLHWSKESRRERELYGQGYPGEDVSLSDRSGMIIVETGYWQFGESDSDACKMQDLRSRLHSHVPELTIPKSEISENSRSVVKVTNGVGTQGEKGVVFEYVLEDGESLLTFPSTNFPYVRIPDLSSASSPRSPEARGVRESDRRKNSDVSGKDQGCRMLVLDFRFDPPLTRGNFGKSGDAFHFSGPVVPFPKNVLYDTEVTFAGMKGVCLQCEQKQEKLVQRYTRFPSPVHLSLGESFSIGSVRVGTLDFAVIGETSSTQFSEIISLTERIVQEEQRERGLDFERYLSGHHFFIFSSLLSEKINLLQSGELQLGASFLKVNPFFLKYHRAAFVRELSTLLIEEMFAQKVSPRTTAELRIVRSIARFRTFKRLPEWFDGLGDFKEFSEKFSFIPLFEDIVEGKALLNNEVFLGKHETPSAIDTQPFESLIPTLSGKDIAERLEFCFTEEQRLQFDEWIMKLGTDAVSLSDFRAQAQAIQSAKCAYTIDQLFSLRPQSESLETEILQLSEGQSMVRYTRSPVDGVFYNERIDANKGTDDEVFRDVPLLSISDSKGKELFLKFWIPSESNILSVPLDAANEVAFKSRISGPALGSEQSQHVYPRHYKFLISGLKFQLDTGEDEVRTESGFLLRATGDRYARSFNLGFALASTEGEINGNFQLNFAPLFGVTSKPWELQRESVFQNYFNSLPFSIGLQNSVPFEKNEGQKPEVSLVTSVGLSLLVGDKLVPQGYTTSLSVRRLILSGEKIASTMSQQLSVGFFQPLGRLTTLQFSPTLGRSDEPEFLSDYIPGNSTERLRVRKYITTRSQIQTVVLSRLDVDLLGSILFQDLMAFAAHYAALDADRFSQNRALTESVQSVAMGFRVFGAFFGAKNQSLSLSLSRSLTDELKNSIVLTIGDD